MFWEQIVAVQNSRSSRNFRRKRQAGPIIVAVQNSRSSRCRIFGPLECLYKGLLLETEMLTLNVSYGPIGQSVSKIHVERVQKKMPDKPKDDIDADV